jgi:hypothetical protein
MADAKHSTGNTAILEAEHDSPHDPLTEGPGVHPIGAGVGAAGGGTIGGAIGGVTGAFAGKGIAESINPTEEDAFWRERHPTRPYAQGRPYEDLRPAYQYGWESRCRLGDCHWNDVETDLQRGWDQAKGDARLGWHEAKAAARDAWDRVDQRFRSTPGAAAADRSK